MPRPRKPGNRELGMGLLAWHLRDVKPIDPASIPQERGTFLAHSGFLDAFAEGLARQVRQMMRAK